MMTRDEKMAKLEADVQRARLPLKYADAGWPTKLLWRLGYDVPPTSFWPVWSFVLLALAILPFPVIPIELLRASVTGTQAFTWFHLSGYVATAVLTGLTLGMLARFSMKRKHLTWG